MILLSLGVVIWFSYPFAKLYECYMESHMTGLWTSLGPVKRRCKNILNPDLSWIWKDNDQSAVFAGNPFGAGPRDPNALNKTRSYYVYCS